VGKPEGMRDAFGDPGVDMWIILRLYCRKSDVVLWSVLSWLRIGQVAGTRKCGNEPSCSIKCGEFLDHLRTS